MSGNRLFNKHLYYHLQYYSDLGTKYTELSPIGVLEPRFMRLSLSLQSNQAGGFFHASHYTTLAGLSIASSREQNHTSRKAMIDFPHFSTMRLQPDHHSAY